MSKPKGWRVIDVSPRIVSRELDGIPNCRVEVQRIWLIDGRNRECALHVLNVGKMPKIGDRIVWCAKIQQVSSPDDPQVDLFGLGELFDPEDEEMREKLRGYEQAEAAQAAYDAYNEHRIRLCGGRGKKAQREAELIEGTKNRETPELGKICLIGGQSPISIW